MKKLHKLLASLTVLALLLCLLPATALAAPGKLAAHMSEQAEAAAEEVEDAEEAAEEAVEEEAAEEAATEDAAQDAEAAEDEEAPDAEAEEEEEGLPPLLPEAVPVQEDEVFYAADGDLVYNNAGLVYNNGATVYNNAGLVYNNGGLVYNNAGTVYSNGGIVYNNGGKVYSNGAVVYAFDGDVENSLIAGYCRVTLAGDYSAFAEIEGLEIEPGTEDSLLMAQDAVVTITPREGFSLVEVTADGVSAEENEDGVWSLSAPTGSFELALRFQADAPEFSLPEGSYVGSRELALTAAEGLTIRYTTDGSVPDLENSLVYEKPFPVEESMTVTAVAEALLADVSPAVSASYAIVSLTAPEFEAVEEGYNLPAAQGIRLDNPGSVTAVVESAALTGGDVDCFTLGRTGGGRVSAQSFNDKSWTVRPVARLEAGVYSATVTFTFDSGSQADVEVSFEVK